MLKSILFFLTVFVGTATATPPTSDELAALRAKLPIRPVVATPRPIPTPPTSVPIIPVQPIARPAVSPTPNATAAPE